MQCPSNGPDFFIVGAPKCGTTAMAHYLAAHPAIFLAQKEMHFFGTDLKFTRSFYRRNFRSYVAEFTPRRHQVRAGEASVWYLFSHKAAAEIHSFNPDAQIIIMLRHPADMLYSLYHQFRFDGTESLPTFAAALAAEPDRRAGRHIPRSNYFHQGLHYRETARFTEQVRRYFDVFGRKRVQVMLYDNLAADAACTCCSALRFLGVQPNGSLVQFKVVNGGQRALRSPALRAMLTEPVLRSAAVASRPFLPRRVFAALRNTESWLWRVNTRTEKRPALAPELRAQLTEEFTDEIGSLGELLRRDLSCWLRPQSTRHPDP